MNSKHDSHLFPDTLNTQNFLLFPVLPLELRRKIWRRTLPLFPRIIEVRPRITPTDAWNPLTTEHHVRSTSPLVLLSINREVREQLLRYYTELNLDSLMVNFKVDMIYFNVAWSTNERIPYLSIVQRLFKHWERDKQLVRRLAVEGHFFLETSVEHDNGNGNTQNRESVVFEFNALEELALVIEQTHLRVERRLVALKDIDMGSEMPETLQISKDLEARAGWRIPRIRICATVAEAEEGLEDEKGVQSQRSYLEKVYGPAFVERFISRG